MTKRFRAFEALDRICENINATKEVISETEDNVEYNTDHDDEEIPLDIQLGGKHTAAQHSPYPHVKTRVTILVVRLTVVSTRSAVTSVKHRRFMFEDCKLAQTASITAGGTRVFC